MLTFKFIIPDSHPSLAGHFPGQPITPGVVSLDYVSQGLLQKLQGMRFDSINHVKFLKPLLPNLEVVVIYKMKNDKLYQFSCECDGSTILIGQIKLVATDE